MRPMKRLLGMLGAVVIVVGCGAAVGSASAEGDELESVSTEREVSATLEGDDDTGSCPPPDKCSAACGRNGDKVRICHRAPPDKKDSKGIELCIAASGAEAHLREHDKDTLGCCKDKHLSP